MMLHSRVDERMDWPLACSRANRFNLSSRISPRGLGYLPMQLRIGYELVYSFPQPTPIILVLSVHDSRTSDIIVPACLITEPCIPITGYRDVFGNQSQRGLAPAGHVRLTADGIIRDSGKPDEVVTDAWQDPVQDLPEDSLVFLLGSRYCETDLLSQAAWQLFGSTTPGYPRVQAICDYVHSHIAFNYQNARPTRSASDAFNERTGVCRDYAHLAITFCRCMNIPARYCTGYLGDAGTPPPFPPGDFAAWFEAWIGGRWHVFDPRNNVPRMSRVLMARGRDASDVAIATTFGPNFLESFKVWTDEIIGTAD
jgi:transglutaminase-like putative cysteine protease